MNETKFTISDDRKTLFVERKFDAPVSKVWDFWTEQELLEQWWAPLPWKAVTKSFEFGEGGHWHYAMTGPEGEQHWGWMGYLHIDPQKNFRGNDLFCDEAGTVDRNLPTADWHNEFIEDGNATLVKVTTTYNSPDELNKVIEMGMKEGLTMTLNQLEELL